MWNSMRPYSPYWIVLLAAWHSAFIIAVCTADKQDLDHYEVLGVPRNAKSADIKRAFRRLAAEHHPDKNKDPGAEARFTEIVEAYEVLTDEQLRAVYDKDGHSGVEKFKREGQASSESQRFRKRQFDIQIEEIIAELLMLFKFAKKANGPWGPNSRPFKQARKARGRLDVQATRQKTGQ
ncbi:PREDICTED: dnaJ homolog subfamily B member 9-like [Branchiostoma belcheri]|uniref:DnaJ homolog subfamily B member 9 n=1 Tax=Branchiostoma belcheri TaxID=7741 RepID=A0A6P5AXW3_BRABE|nr:PREDICTED: dnaJ homolog subfamily B member 9-like [Branchiostoma belcheri]